VARVKSEGLSVIVKDIVSVGRRVAVQLAGVMAGQEKALHNARRASTEVSRRRVERDEVAIYLGSLDESAGTDPANNIANTANTATTDTPAAANRAR
jgi:hypothetical protein